MRPFQEYKLKKSSGKERARSLIPRPVPQPLRSKGSPVSELLYEEESKGSSIICRGHSKRTISPTSFSSDDTGCPSSQCASPTKTRSGSDNSPLGSPPSPAERTAKIKKVRVNVIAEWNSPVLKHRREKHHPSNLHKGSEADFSSSSNGSFKTREGLLSNSTGKKNSLSHSSVAHIRSRPVFKPPGSPTAPCDAELYAPYRTPPKPHLSSSICSNSSPTRRTAPRSYHSCGDNHGIKPPHPEQYLTPLQQKEVTIRHLRTKLKESEQIVHDRDSEIQELKSQLGRMREDWIEEECHRVEAQLSLKEARKEIKQLREVVETMKNSLMEKDKGIQKYFIDINIQNKKLESLLRSMELAQSGTNLHDESTLDFISDSPEKPIIVKLEDALQAEDQEMADSGLLVNDDLANRMDVLEKVLMSTAVDSSQCGAKMAQSTQDGPGVSTLTESGSDDSGKSARAQIWNEISAEDKAVQTEELFYPSDLHALLCQLLKLQNTGVSSALVQKLPKFQDPPDAPQADEAIKNNVLPQDPMKREQADISSGPVPKFVVLQDPGGSNQVLDHGVDPSLKKKLDFGLRDTCSRGGKAAVGKSHWSNSYLADLFAIAAPILPTVAWLYAQRGKDGPAPANSAATLIRGCCVMGLHSLRLVTYGPHV